MAGRQASLRDFFLGGKRLPWYAVSASIVATEISAVTYISLPSVVFKTGGNLTYLQIGLIGSLFARGFVAWKLVPAYFQREIYSPYDFVGERLGEGMRRATTALFTLGGLLGQSARVYMTAVVLEVLLYEPLSSIENWCGIPPLTTAVVMIGLVAIVWTWMGGIAAVIWTDTILFVLFIVGAAVSLIVIDSSLESGLFASLPAARDLGKLQWLDFDTSPVRAYTFWAALIGASWGGVGSYGVDQLMAQRMFCCRNARDARKAILASYVAVAVTCVVACIGLGLWAYYREFPLQGAAAELVASRPDRIFPVFITEVLPAGLKGLVIAGAFAAAISSLDSILAALCQTTLSAVFIPLRSKQNEGTTTDSEADSASLLRLSRILVVVWGVILCALAIGIESIADRYDAILDLALAMAGYSGGALLAAFALAYLPTGRDGRGFFWAAPLSVLWILAVVWHEPWSLWLCAGGGVSLVVHYSWWQARLASFSVIKSALLALGAAGVVATTKYAVFEGGGVVAWPWYIPLGSLIAFGFGYALSAPCIASNAQHAQDPATSV
ncbi:MAG: SSS family solute:Na+ symporter [Planctomycetota bacterium]|jgi:SSS family solute:Na+ symporter